MNIKDELLRVVDTLTGARIEYAIAGGLAVAIHGCPRLTVDIDLVIREDELDRARQALTATGFDLESSSIRLSPGPAAVEQLFRLTKAEGAEYLTLDLLELWKLLRTARRSSASGDAKWFPGNNPKSSAT